MRKIRVGLITFSDGRQYIHREMLTTNQNYQHTIRDALEKTGYIEVVAAREIIGNPQAAKTEGQYIASQHVDMTICNYAIWCYPNLTVIATNFSPGPYILFCNLHPSKCGMVGMMAAAGAMDQLGRKYKKIWGDIHDPKVLERLLVNIRGAFATSQLKGQTMGLFGGRPLGMYSAVSNLDQWQKLFGVDIDHCEQYEIIQRAEQIDQKKIEYARKFLEEHARVLYDGVVLTKKIFEKQIRTYYALKEIIDEKKYDFIGIKSIGDLTDYWCTVDVAEAFLNDPYDWDGPKEPIVAATEADMDGALTMQLFKYLCRGEQAVLFADVRHYDWDNDIWFFSNSGTHATYFAGRSLHIEENLKYVKFKPECSDYPAGGASVHHFAAPGKVTFARLARNEKGYWMAIVPGEIVQFDMQTMEAYGNMATPEWPIAFTRLSVSPEYFLENFPCNHIHGIYGEYVEELKQICAQYDLPYKVFSDEEGI